MPTYRYRCDTCSEDIEVWQSIHDDPLTTHEADGGALRKVLQPVGVVLKGSGFYKNDSRSGSSKNGSGSSGSKDKGPGDSGSKDSTPAKDTASTSDSSSTTSDAKPASTPKSDS